MTEVSESVDPVVASDDHSDSSVEEFVEDEPEEVIPSILQSMFRRLLDDGSEAVEGPSESISARANGQPRSTLHSPHRLPIDRVSSARHSPISTVECELASHKAMGSASKHADPNRLVDAVCVDIGFSAHVAKAQERHLTGKPAERPVTRYADAGFVLRSRRAGVMPGGLEAVGTLGFAVVESLGELKADLPAGGTFAGGFHTFCQRHDPQVHHHFHQRFEQPACTRTPDRCLE